MYQRRTAGIANYGIALASLALTLWLTPNASFAQATKMKQTFKNVSTTDANDFHMETTLFILKNPAPTSTEFTKVKVVGGTGTADFDTGTVKAGKTHTVEWSASGKNSKLTDHYFTFNGNEIDKSSKLVALTQDFDATPSGGTYLASVTNFNESGGSLTGDYSIFAKPLVDFGTSLWDDTGDADLLSGPTLYSLISGGSEGPMNFSLLPDQYLLIVGTADDGEGSVGFRSAFSPTFTAAPEPGSVMLVGMVALPLAGMLRRRIVR